MGIAAGDYENNGLIDFFVTDFGDDYKVLYHNDGDASFTDVSYKAGVAQTTIPFVGWGDGFIDYDNDGWLDLFMVNGHVYPQVDQHDWGTTFAERPLLFHNVPERSRQGTQVRLRSAGEGIGTGGRDPGARRGLRRPIQQRQDRRGHQSHRRPAGAAAQRKSRSSSLGGMKLVGGPQKPARRHLRYRVSDAPMACASARMYWPAAVTFPPTTGACTSAWATPRTPGTVEIHWPSGAKETIKLPAVDRIYTITEGKGITRPD